MATLTLVLFVRVASIVLYVKNASDVIRSETGFPIYNQLYTVTGSRADSTAEIAICLHLAFTFHIGKYSLFTIKIIIINNCPSDDE